MPARRTKGSGRRGWRDGIAGKGRRERRNGVFKKLMIPKKKKEMALKKNGKMALIKMALTIRVDGAQAQSGGDENRQRKWGNKKKESRLELLIKNWRRPTFPQTSAVSSAM